MIVQCCVCGKIRRGERWVRCSESVLEGEVVSHGYCPECAARAFEELRAHPVAPEALAKLKVRIAPIAPLLSRLPPLSG